MHIDMSAQPCENCNMIMVNYADLWIVHTQVAICWVLRAERLMSTNEGVMKVTNETTRHVVTGTKILTNQSTPRAGSPWGSIYSGRLQV
jgi:hypothetical protein